MQLLLAWACQYHCESGDYEFLKLEPDGGYHDPLGFVRQVREEWLDRVEDEVRAATGLVDDTQHEELFDRYVTQISLLLKGERYYDAHTGQYKEPDQNLFNRIEDLLEVPDPEEFRTNLINGIAAHAIDNPGDDLRPSKVFPDYLRALKEAYYIEHRDQIATLITDVLRIIDDTEDDRAALEPAARAAADTVRKRLKEDFSYCDPCARATLAVLLKERYEAHPILR